MFHTGCDNRKVTETAAWRPPGVREAKKAETRARITAAGLRLFREFGYDGTTLDAIAEAAGISRRTFFYYFASKDEVLLAWEGAGRISSSLGRAISTAPERRSPLLTARDCLMALSEQYETPEAKEMDRLMHSTDSLRAAKDKTFAGMERTLVAAFKERWPDPARRLELTVAATLSIGLLRVAIDGWRATEMGRPLADYLAEVFDEASQLGWR